MHSPLNIYNTCKVSITKEDWQVVSEQTFYNMTCQKGRASIARRLADSVTTDLWVAKYIAIGDNSTAATELDIKLWNELYREPIKTSETILTDNVVKIYARFPIWIATTIAEAGVFTDNDATVINGSWSLLCHSVFTTPITKVTNEVATIERTISIVNAV